MAELNIKVPLCSLIETPRCLNWNLDQWNLRMCLQIYILMFKTNPKKLQTSKKKSKLEKLKFGMYIAYYNV